MYAEVGAVHNKIHNLYRAFSLQPAPLLAADQHHRDILHDENNQSDPWFLELFASQAAIIASRHDPSTLLRRGYFHRADSG